MTVTFFVEYALKSQALAYKNGKKRSVFNSSHNNSSVDDAPSE